MQECSKMTAQYQGESLQFCLEQIRVVWGESFISYAYFCVFTVSECVEGRFRLLVAWS